MFKLMRWIFPKEPTNEQYAELMKEHMMRCNDYYFKPAVQAWLEEEVKNLGTTVEKYSAWVNANGKLYMS